MKWGEVGVRANLGGHLKYSQRWSGVHAGVLLGALGTVCRVRDDTGEKDPNTHQAHAGYIGSTDNK